MNKELLDENLPVKLKYRLQDIVEIFTVNDKGWNALENGDLLAAMVKDGFLNRSCLHKLFQASLIFTSVGLTKSNRSNTWVGVLLVKVSLPAFLSNSVFFIIAYFHLLANGVIQYNIF